MAECSVACPTLVQVDAPKGCRGRRRARCHPILQSANAHIAHLMLHCHRHTRPEILIEGLAGGEQGGPPLRHPLQRALPDVGYAPGFCWLRVRYLETISSSRPSDNQGNFRESCAFFLPRLKKSGIEYVILAKSSLFDVVGGSIPIWVGFGIFLAAHSARFFKDWDFFAPEIAIFRSFSGASVGSEGSRGVSRGGTVWTVSRRGSDFQGNFRNRVFLRGVR